jgi:hypothetical protein
MKGSGQAAAEETATTNPFHRKGARWAPSAHRKGARWAPLAFQETRHD